MIVKRFIILVGLITFLAACAGGSKPIVYKHPETKDIILLDKDTLQCEPLFRKAGFRKIEAGLED